MQSNYHKRTNLKIVEFPMNIPGHFPNMNTCVYSPDPVSYYNPLHIAVLRNRPNMVRLLAGSGADIEKRDRVRQLSLLCLCRLMAFFMLLYKYYQCSIHIYEYIFMNTDP